MTRTLMVFPMLAVAFAGFARGEKKLHGELDRLPVPEDAIDGKTLFYSAYMKGTKIGWVSEVASKRKRAGREVFCVRTETRTSAKAFGAEVKSSEVEELWFDTEAPHPFVGGRQIAQGGGLMQHIELAPKEKGDGFRVTVKEADSTKEREWDPGDFQLADVTTPTAWIRNKPEVGDVVRVRSLSLGELKASVDILTVKEIPKDGDEEGTFLTRLVNSERGEVGTAEISQGGQLEEMRIGGGTFVVRREEEAKARVVVASDVDLFNDNIVKVEKELGNPSRLRRMALEIHGTGVEKIPSGPNQTANFDEKTGILTLRTGKGEGVSSPTTEEEIAEALEDTVSYPAKDEEVVSLARKAIRKAGDDKAKRVAALIRFVGRFIKDDPTAKSMTVSDIIKERVGDCTEHALLFVTMARAVGIPAREVSGLYYADEIGGFGGHAWAEVALDGRWVPVDPAWGQTWVDPAHIRIYTEGVSDYAQQVVQLADDLEIKVLEMEQSK